jgi:hypothetical protein
MWVSIVSAAWWIWSAGSPAEAELAAVADGLTGAGGAQLARTSTAGA